jgi:hypothetical protein
MYYQVMVKVPVKVEKELYYYEGKILMMIVVYRYIDDNVRRKDQEALFKSILLFDSFHSLLESFFPSITIVLGK